MALRATLTSALGPAVQLLTVRVFAAAVGSMTTVAAAFPTASARLTQAAVGATGTAFVAASGV